MKLPFQTLAVFAVAAIAAILTSAFTPASENARTMYTFQYTGPNSYQEQDVQDRDNWDYVGGSTLCDSEDDKACRIQVSDDYITLIDEVPHLDESLEISTDVSSVNKAFVDNLTDPSGVISNSSE